MCLPALLWYDKIVLNLIWKYTRRKENGNAQAPEWSVTCLLYTSIASVVCGSSYLNLHYPRSVRSLYRAYSALITGLINFKLGAVQQTVLIVIIPLINAKLSFIRIIPVSYTHLDVYKRQRQVSVSFCPVINFLNVLEADAVVCHC